MTRVARRQHVGDGPPLVLLHGCAMHGGLFAPIVPALAQRHRVHVVDLPGHGHSPRPPPYTLARRSSASLAVASRRSASRRRCSAGRSAASSRCASRSAPAARRGARARLHDAALRRRRRTGRTRWRRRRWRASATSCAFAYRLTLQRFLTLQVQGSDEGRATLASLRDALFARGEPSPATLAGALEVLDGTDLRDDVPRITAPTLVVTGQRDALTPAAAGAWLARAMPARAPRRHRRRRARAVPVAPRRVRARGVTRSSMARRAFRRLIRATSTRAPCGARSAAPRRRTTRRRCCNARSARAWPRGSTT